MARLIRNPSFWLTCFLLWFVVLWVLSSFSLGNQLAVPVANFDKLEHFGYFFGGSGLLCAYLFRRNPDRPRKCQGERCPPTEFLRRRRPQAEKER